MTCRRWPADRPTGLDALGAQGYRRDVTVPARNRQEATERIAACAAEIRELGVLRLALFGSVLRGDASPDSDADLIVHFAPGMKSYDRFLALSELLESRLGRHVELVTPEALSPFIGPSILAEAVDVLRAA